MNLTGSELLSVQSSWSREEDFLIKKILLTHDPDGRHLDSEMLLQAFQNVMYYATTSQVSDLHTGDIIISNTQVGSDETLGHTIYMISRHLLLTGYEDGDLHTKTMLLFDILGPYKWDAKVVLILAAFAISYGEFWLIMQLYNYNPLAASIAVLKQLPNDIETLRPRFKALSFLVNALVEVAKCIIKFEGLPLQQVLLDYKAMAATKYQIYIATYWIFRSSLACTSQITDLTVENHRHSHSTTIAVWGLSSLAIRISSLCSDLRRQVDMCHQQIETRLYMKLLDLFKETYDDNQEVLHMLFALKDDLPLKDSSSQVMVGISELKNKVVIMLVSKLELLPIEKILLLVEQTYNYPNHKKIEGSYEILWVPIPSSDTWTLDEERSFNFFSDTLPWFSIRQPLLLNSAVVKFIKQEWNFKGEPLMVVLDLQGVVTNSNAIDMVFIWGARAFPFSSSREKELWEEENWTMQLMMDGIDPFLMHLVEEDKNLCIYSSDNLDWIREFNSRMKEIKTAGLQLEVIYVGRRNPSEHLHNIFATIDEENLNVSLTLTRIHFFWLRLESMKNSILRVEKTINNDSILIELLGLLNMDDNDKDWVVIGRGSSTDIIKLQGRRVMECIDHFSAWGENVAKFGLVGAIRNELQPPLHRATDCDHANIIPYEEGLIQGSVVCDKCKRPMEKFVVYNCDVIE